ncbi:MAG: response regulator [Bacteroidales bacterium]|nr:response regulator [Bacteroidales bacterium]
MINIADKKILVVEDDDMNYIYLKQAFKIMNAGFVRSKTGLSAVEACREQSFDIILLDLKLPDISGYEVISEIRKFNGKIPIIVQTASKTPDEHNKAISLGCNGILVKPFKVDELYDVLRKFLM